MQIQQQCQVQEYHTKIELELVSEILISASKNPTCTYGPSVVPPAVILKDLSTYLLVSTVAAYIEMWELN